MAGPVRTVLSTAPDEGTGRALASALVDEGLAACVSVIPGVTSVYRWQGELRTEGEVLLLAKTVAELVPALTARLVELHPYEVPEVLTLAVSGGHEPYLAWVASVVREAP